MYEIVFYSRFERVFKKLDKKIQRLILDELDHLSTDPFSHPNTRMIVGVQQKAFRIRIGRWRVIYIVVTKQHVIEVIDLFLRKGHKDYKHL